jgi:hypothetical protein
VVPIERVTQVGSAVAVDEYAAKALDDAFGLEQWLRHYVVSRIPGAKGGGDDRNEEQPQPDASAGAGKEGGGATRGSVGSPLRSPLPGATFVGDFVGRRVVDAASQKDVGLVCELHAAAGPLDRPQGPMQITHLQYGRHQRGSELGYNADQKQGPWVVAALVRHWQRENRVVPMVRLKDLGSADRPVVIPNSAGLPHPYDVTDW